MRRLALGLIIATAACVGGANASTMIVHNGPHRTVIIQHRHGLQKLIHGARKKTVIIHHAS